MNVLVVEKIASFSIRQEKSACFLKNIRYFYLKLFQMLFVRLIAHIYDKAMRNKEFQIVFRRGTFDLICPARRARRFSVHVSASEREIPCDEITFSASTLALRCESLGTNENSHAPGIQSLRKSSECERGRRVIFRNIFRMHQRRGYVSNIFTSDTVLTKEFRARMNPRHR